MSDLLAKFQQKDAELDLVITYPCPIMQEEFYFKQSNLTDEQIVVDTTKSMSSSDALIVTYLYYNCDEDGVRVSDYKDRKIRKALRKSESFGEHCVKALTFIGQHTPQDKDDEEDEVVKAKKPSSPASKEGS